MVVHCLYYYIGMYIVSQFSFCRIELFPFPNLLIKKKLSACCIKFLKMLALETKDFFLLDYVVFRWNTTITSPSCLTSSHLTIPRSCGPRRSWCCIGGRHDPRSYRKQRTRSLRWRRRPSHCWKIMKGACLCIKPIRSPVKKCLFLLYLDSLFKFWVSGCYWRNNFIFKVAKKLNRESSFKQP